MRVLEVLSTPYFGSTIQDFLWPLAFLHVSSMTGVSSGRGQDGSMSGRRGFLDLVHLDSSTRDDRSDKAYKYL